MLFDVIPDNFFVPLSSPGKVVYWDCICRLFSVMDRQLSFGVERDVLVDELQFYFDSVMSGDIIDGEEDSREKDSREKANMILRKLEGYGWISCETDKSYIQRINFKDYAVSVIKTLLNVSEEQKVEYQAYIYTVYNLVRAGGENPGLGLLQIVENTDHLVTGLKNLNANIKQYIDDLTKHSTIAEIMDALLNDYYTNIVDKAYHRLLTSDNVSKFRPEIISRMESKSRSKVFLEKASKEISELKEISVEEARELVLHMLHEVIETFRQLDDILEEINKKNSKYQRAAINRAKFLLSSSEDVRGQLKEIILTLNRRIEAEQMDYNGIYELEFLDALVKIYSWEFLDMSSLYAPSEGKREFHPEPIAIRQPDEKLRQEKRDKMRDRLERILSVEKIEAYVEELLQGREVILASQIEPADMETFIRLIYIRLYGQRKRVHYRIVPKEMAEQNGYRYRDFEIWKRHS